MSARIIADRYRWDLPVQPDLVMDILRDVEALPALTKPHLPAWAIVDMTSTVIQRDHDGSPVVVRTVASTLGIKDSFTSRYQWTESSCQWRVETSRVLKSAACEFQVTPSAQGTHLAVDSRAEFKALLLPGAIFRQFQKLQRLGIEKLEDIIVTEAARREELKGNQT